MVQNDKKLCSSRSMSRTHTSYDCHLWYTWLKMAISPGFFVFVFVFVFFIFFKILIYQIFSTSVSAGNGQLCQQNVIEDRKSFITQSKLTIF